MQHIKHRVTSPYGIGFVCHIVSQRCGLMEFRRLYRSHRNDDRRKTARGLLAARQAVRAEVAKWEAGVEADRQHVAKLLLIKQ